MASKRQAVGLERAPDFTEVLGFIEAAKVRAYQAVNSELVGLYWRLGEYLSGKLERSEWGAGVVEALAHEIARRHPGLRGFTRDGLFRMRQFYEAYRGNEIVAPLARQLAWTSHLVILGACKSPEERAFYVISAVRERWTRRELDRQIRAQAWARSDTRRTQAAPELERAHPGALSEFKSAYALEFLGLSPGHSEADLHAALLQNLGRFITELGRDFCFAGSEYPLQVGAQDFSLDLLFFHRRLQCLVAVELKVRAFQPEDLGKLNFYLEALDRDVRLPHERPSIGVLLCATKDVNVVEYALNRSLSPTLVAEYQAVLPAKEVLQQKLQEFYALLEPPGEE
ncbi:MAG: hypothetical protein RL653_1164 [Pseudomonadota bacterium]|jgi:predicted nuclease of restriction endonuclease-like (RecB) superfamily